MPVADYWGLFKTTFPNLADSLFTNLHHIPIATTIAEQVFTIFNNHSGENKAESTVCNGKYVHMYLYIYVLMYVYVHVNVNVIMILYLN